MDENKHSGLAFSQGGRRYCRSDRKDRSDESARRDKKDKRDESDKRQRDGRVAEVFFAF